MRLELLKKPVYIPNTIIHISNYVHIGNYGNHPIYISKIVSRSGVATYGREGEIFINNEVYELLQEFLGSPKFKEFLETICEHEVRHYTHESRARTDEELEVLEFLRKQGVNV